MGSTYLRLGEYQKAIKYYVQSLEIVDTSTGDQSGVARNNENLGIVYFNLGDYKRAWSHLEDAVRISDKMFFNFVPDRHKLFFITQYFFSHRLLMSCFLSFERAKSALLAIDLGKAKELHFCIEKNRNCADMEMKDFVQIEEIQQFLQTAKSDASTLVFVFDREGPLNIWVLNEDFVYRKVDAVGEAILSLIVELLGMVNVNVGRNSSFQENVSVKSKIPTIRQITPLGSQVESHNLKVRLQKLLDMIVVVLRKFYENCFNL